MAARNVGNVSIVAPGGPAYEPADRFEGLLTIIPYLGPESDRLEVSFGELSRLPVNGNG